MKGLLFTYALTYGGAVVSLFNPFYGLLIYILFANIRPESLWFWSVPQGNYSRIIAVAFLVGWVMNGLGNWSFGRARLVAIALLGFWAWTMFSAAAAPNQAVAWRFVENISKILLPCLAGLTLINSVSQLKQLAWVIVVSQGYVAYDLNGTFYSGFNRLHEAGYGGMDNNSFAISMVTSGGIAFFLGLHESVWWKKLICFAAAALMVHCCMFAFSRGAMLALCVLAAVSFIFVAAQPKHWWALALGFVVAVGLAGNEVRERFVSVFMDKQERDFSAQSRLDLWQDCLTVMNDSPLLGCGPDHWPLMAESFGWPPGKEAHTLWLQLGAELGYPGLALLLCYYGTCCLLLWSFWRQRETYLAQGMDPFLPDVATMVISSIAGFVVAAQFVSLEGLEVPYYVTLLGAGALKLSSQYVVLPDESGDEPTASAIDLRVLVADS